MVLTRLKLFEMENDKAGIKDSSSGTTVHRQQRLHVRGLRRNEFRR